MYAGLIILHVVVCLVLILFVLLQSGKGADMGAAFGGSSQTLFGSAGPGGFLAKLTTGAAIIFMITSLVLAWWSSTKRVVSVIPEEKKQEQSKPKGPGNFPLSQRNQSSPEKR